MFDVKFSDIIKSSFPDLKVLQIEARVKNSPTSNELWDEILKASEELQNKYTLPELNKRTSIDATRKAYKKLGKDPNRYRPSAEALGRRIISGKGIYRLSALIDIINLVSIKTGYSIGGFDASKIAGYTLTLDAGTSSDIFNAIGRGILNIEGLPVYRDNLGGIGTPTSDEERTKILPETQSLLMLVNIYGEEKSSEATENLLSSLLEKYAGLEKFESKLLQVKDILT
ncbi:MAG: hypothetical protein J1D77_08420 [Muribaculaceae bacterium]|nr:hypothetical protein [Muribaculaceae bacterium]